MFILCPHCQFLVAIDPASGLPPAQCPRCGKAMAPGPAAAAPDGPTGTADVGAPSAATDDEPASEAPPSPAPGTGDATTARPGDAGADAAAVTAPDAPRRRPSAAVQAALRGPSRPAAATGDTAALPAPRSRRKANRPAADAAGAGASAPANASERAPAGRVQAEPGAGHHAPARAAETDAQAASPAPEPGTPDSEGTEGAATTPQPDPALPAAAPRAAAAAPRIAPSFARGAQAGARPPWRAVAAIAGLALLLVVQVLLADRAALAADARWRPLVATLCGALRCTLPAWHEPDAFTLLARDVRPARAGVLHVSASFRNDARWAQAWPRLRLALQDVDGRTVGARTLAPTEYLGRPVTEKGLATGQVAQVAFDVAEPDATVVAFTFDFR